MPFAEAGRSALRKLASVMATAPRDHASKLVSRIRVRVDHNRQAGAVEPVANVLEQALIASVAVELNYRDGQGRHTLRVVEPAGVLGTSKGWYLAAFCRLRQAPRAFRLDRIAEARLTGEPIAPRPLDAILPDLPFELTEPALM
jgi:predicted DNA-binding transcriptional regulator YafY